MTEEQIKQNAEAYAEKNKHAEITLNQMAYAAYIAGAHSRDEEIEILEHQLNNTSINLKIARKEIDQLRNPWISVEERLPEKAKGLYELEKDEQHKMVLLKTANGKLFRGYLDAEEIWRAFTVPYKGAYPIDSLTWAKVTHWMPIPELKKGE